MPDIIVMGDINVDVNLTISAYPTPGNEAIATAVQMHTGGSGVNTAIALAMMDMNVGFIGRIGNDTFAQQVLADLAKTGVDYSHIQTDSRVSTGLIFIAVTVDGERTMFAVRGANAFTEASKIDQSYFRYCRWLHLSGYSFLSYHQYETLKVALEIAKNSPHTRISLDVGTEPAMRARSNIMEILSQVDVIFPNEVELSLLTEGRSLDDGLDYLLSHGAKAIVTKRGYYGSILALPNKRLAIPSFDIQAKDSTGAGDSFNAGVVLGRLVGLSWEASVALGNALGGLATTQEGSGAASLNRKNVNKLVERHLFREEWLSEQIILEELIAYFETGL